MNQLLIDNTLLASALLTSIVVSKCLRKRKTSAVFSSFLLFPPLVVFLNMWAHTVAVSIVNIQRYAAGTFHYTFTLYGHFLFGIVFIVLSGLLIHFSRTYVQGNRRQKRKIFLGNLGLALSFFPVFFLNPIGSLPVIAAILSSLILWLWNPYKNESKRFQTIDMKTEQSSQTVANM